MSRNSNISKNISDFAIPTYALQNRNHTILEALVTYLKEKKKLSFRKIAATINRDLRHTYNSYKNAKIKQPITQYKVSTKFLKIPLNIFTNRTLSPLETLVHYLKTEHSLTYHKIAIILNRDDRTIWTVYQRAQNKYGKKN